MTEHEHWLAEFHALTLETLEIHSRHIALRKAYRDLRWYQYNRRRDLINELQELSRRLETIQDEQQYLLIDKLRAELDSEQCKLLFKENGLL